MLPSNHFQWNDCSLQTDMKASVKWKFKQVTQKQVYRMGLQKNQKAYK